MILSDTTDIAVSPATIFDFFEEAEEHYRDWHPDHVLFRWIDGRGVRVGNVFYFEERINGKLLKKRVAFTKVIPDRLIEFAPTFWLMRLFLPRMLFRIEPNAGGVRVTAEIHLRMGPLARWAERKEIAAVREHMRVEGINLKRITEAQAS